MQRRQHRKRLKTGRKSIHKSLVRIVRCLQRIDKTLKDLITVKKIEVKMEKKEGGNIQTDSEYLERDLSFVKKEEIKEKEYLSHSIKRNTIQREHLNYFDEKSDDENDVEESRTRSNITEVSGPEPKIEETVFNNFVVQNLELRVTQHLQMATLAGNFKSDLENLMARQADLTDIESKKIQLENKYEKEQANLLREHEKKRKNL